MSESTKMILIAEPKGTTPQTLTPEIRESVKNLFASPGFKYLLNRLGLEREYMRKTLETESHADIRTVERLQNGIHWTKWLEAEARKIAQVPVPQAPARQLRKSEMEMLAEIRANIIDPIYGEGTDSATKP